MTPGTTNPAASTAAVPARPGLMAQLRSPALWLLLALFAAEFLLFDFYGAKRHTSIYPRWNDQIQYLTESYAAYENARTQGLVTGLRQALTNPSAQGTLHDVLALLAFTVAGPSRSAALALNLFALIAWQAALYAAVVRARGDRWLGVTAALLPVLLAGPWANIPGSAYDFRLDHLAMCTLGITAAVAWMTDGLHSRGAATWLGVAVGVTLLTRFLTGTYFAVIFLGLLAWALAGPERGPRTAHLVRAAVVAALIAGPILWLNYDAVREYYWIGHFVGPESAIRNPHLGLGGSLAFVAEHLAQRHLGGVIVVAVLLVAGALAFCRTGAARPADRQPWILGSIFLFSPALVLTLHQQKSEVVISALVPGAVLLAVALWLQAGRRARPATTRTCALALSVAALAYFVHTQVPPLHPPTTQTELRIVNSVADEIFRRARAAGLKEPNIAVDHITDALDAQVLRVVNYERRRVLPPARMTLPTGIAEPTDSQVMTRLAESDFVFLTVEGPAGHYPFDRKLAALRPQLRAWCEAHLRVAHQFDLYGRRIVLYQRREIPFP